MITQKGDVGLNAEIKIDLQSRKVDFHYPVLDNVKEEKKIRRKKDLAYFRDGIPRTIAIVAGYIMAGRILANTEMVNRTDANALIYMVTIIAFVTLSTIYLIGMLMIFLNKTIKPIRENYPKRQGIPRKWKKIELPQRNGAQIIKNNEMYILDYSIGRFEYEYIGDNKIVEIETISQETKEHKEEHFDFIAKFTFEKPITDGIFMYR